MAQYKNFLLPVFVTTATSLLLAVLLAATYHFFESDIRMQEQKVLEEAVRSVIPQAVTVDSVEKDTSTDNEKPIDYYIGKDQQGAIVGYAFLTSAMGYSSLNQFIVGYNRRLENITAINVLKHSETPGLGSEMTKEIFKKQFAGSSIQTKLTVVKNQTAAITPGEINAITGATITSRSVVTAVNEINQKIHHWIDTGILIPAEGDKEAKKTGESDGE